MLAGPSATSARVHQKAAARPAAPPSTPSRMLSARNCRTRRARPAPSAARTATSRVRDCARASSRFATLTHAISSTKLTAPSSTSSVCRTLLHHPLVQRHGDRGRAAVGSSGTRAARRAATVCSAAVDRGTSLSGFSRATTEIHCAPRACGARSRGVKISGRQNSAFAGRVDVRRRDADDRARAAVQPDRRADGVGASRRTAAATSPSLITTTLPSPEPSASTNPRPVAHRHAEDGEVVPRHARAVEALAARRSPVRLAVAGVKAAASWNAPLCVDEVAIVRRREPRRDASRAAVEQHDQPIGIVIRQRPQQHAVDDGEDGGVGADAERERQHGDEREAGLPAQHARGVAKVLQRAELTCSHSFAGRPMA